jgi:hypothetical protein
MDLYMIQERFPSQLSAAGTPAPSFLPSSGLAAIPPSIPASSGLGTTPPSFPASSGLVTTTPSFSALEEEVRRMVTARVRSQLIREVATNQKALISLFLHWYRNFQHSKILKKIQNI